MQKIDVAYIPVALQELVPPHVFAEFQQLASAEGLTLGSGLAVAVAEYVKAHKPLAPAPALPVSSSVSKEAAA